MKKISITFCFLVSLVFLHNCENSLKWDDFSEGNQIILRVEQPSDVANDLNHINDIVKIISQRLECFGVDKYIIKEKKNDIVVQMAKYEEISRIVDLISKRGKFEFRVVGTPANSDYLDLEKLHFETQNSTLYVEKESKIANQHIEEVRVRISPRNNKPYLLIEFNPIGSEVLSKITGDNINNRIAIVIDNLIHSAPVVREKITGGSAIVTGDFTPEEAFDLSIMLKYDAFPQEIRLIRVETLEYRDWLGEKL